MKHSIALAALVVTSFGLTALPTVAQEAGTPVAQPVSREVHRTITRDGDVENCKIIKGLPHMDEAVLQTLETWRYTPVRYQGKPISVSYTFNVKLDLPR